MPPPSSSTPLLVNQRDGRVVVGVQDDAGWSVRDVAATGRWPAWSPDGRWTVRSDMVRSGESGRSVVLAQSLDGAASATIHEGQPGEATFIAPNVPHYALWSPDSTAVSYVAATEHGLSLAFSTIDGRLSEHRVATGVPLFHSWSPDGRRIAVHEGSRLALIDVDTLVTTEVHQNALGFRTPQFVPDGGLVYSSPAPSGGMALFLQDTRGRALQLGRFDGGLAFLIAGPDVFVAVTHRADASAFDSLWRVALDGSGTQLLARGPLAAFWPSPAGDIIVIAVPTQAGDARIALHARSRDGEMLGATEPILPSDDFRVCMAFFDQYALSHSPWTPAGDRFALCGQVGTDTVSASFGDPVGDSVMTWIPARSQPLDRVIPGTVASFPLSPVAGEAASQ